MDYLYVYRIKKHFKYKRLETCNEKKTIIYYLFIYYFSIN